MADKPENQHDVPSTYLRRFAIDSSDSGKKKMVNCLRIHHKKKIEEKSVEANFFKNRNFYTIEGDNPFLIEDIFANIIEPSYNDIFGEISKEKNLSEDVRGKMILWLWFSKFRNIHQRRIIEQHIDFHNSINSKYALDFPKDITKEGIDNIQKEYSKNLHIKGLFDEKIMQKFIEGMAVKDWIILKSSANNKFITNDNPGFSVNIEKGKPDYNSINVQFATNRAATNYYPISPDYCLMINPLLEASLDLSLLNLKIRYVEANESHIDFINMTTYLQLRKYCIANEKKYLEKYLSIDFLPQKDFSKFPVFPLGGVTIREGEEFLTKKNRE